MIVAAEPVGDSGADTIDRAMLERWLTLVADGAGIEHVVLSDGRHRIRLDIAQGSLAAGQPVLLRYQLAGVRSAERRVQPLRRFLHLCRRRRFSRALFPATAGMDRQIDMLRVYDALRQGATQSQIAEVLFGADDAARDRRRGSDSIRSRVRRLIADARKLAGGHYRSLLLDRSD